MKVIVMGCGRVGSQVARLLDQRGHQVTVIDHRDADAAMRLGNEFKGQVVHGLGFDRDALRQADIQHAEAFVAASSSDNANIVAARIARNLFKVPRVIARMYDPLHAEIYRQLGLMTISGTELGVRRIYEMVTHNELDAIHKFGRGEVSLIRVETGPALSGRTPRDLNIPGEVSLVTITRADRAFLPSAGTEFREGDILHLAVLASAMPRLEALLDLEGRP